MDTIEFAAAYYIKLGRSGAWESDCIQTGKLRLGWGEQSVEDINAGRWKRIGQQLREEHRDKPARVATTDLGMLRMIAESSADDVWIAF